MTRFLCRAAFGWINGWGESKVGDVKKFADFWWLIAVGTIVVYFIYSNALGDLKRFDNNNSGVNALAKGFIHGLAFDLEFPERVEAAETKLISWAVLWQNIFRFCFIATLITGGAKFYFGRQPKPGTTKHDA